MERGVPRGPGAAACGLAGRYDLAVGHDRLELVRLTGGAHQVPAQKGRTLRVDRRTRAAGRRRGSIGSTRADLRRGCLTRKFLVEVSGQHANRVVFVTTVAVLEMGLRGEHPLTGDIM